MRLRCGAAAAEPLGLALATEQTHAMLHAHGARPSGIISVAKNLDEKELVRLATWVKKHYSGLDNVSRVLDNDAKFTPFDMKGVDAEYIKLRNHEIESICHGMGVLPIVIGYPAEMAARAAAETLIAMHLVHTIRPWHRRFEKAFNRQLQSRDDRKAGYYTKFIDGEFLRATAKDRAEYNTPSTTSGTGTTWMSTRAAITSTPPSMPARSDRTACRSCQIRTRSRGRVRACTREAKDPLWLASA
jgi:HK97 family phage portal protein